MAKMINKAIAALLALCLMLGGGLGALAEQDNPDVVGDVLRYLMGVTKEEEDAIIAEETADESDDVEYVVDGDEEDEEEIVVEEHVNVTDLAVTPGLSDDWMNILLLGTDARGSTKYLRTDTMIVLSINAKTNRMKLSSIMRDIWVQIPGYGGQKLNAACVYGGPELTIRTINEYFGLNIEKYALVNMQCLVQIVDTLGGIEMNVTPAESGAIRRLNASSAGAKDGSGKYISDAVPSGENVLLNGKQALAYSRIRKSDSDYARTSRQRNVLVAIAKKMQGVSVLRLAGIVTTMLQYVETNLSFDEIMNLAGVCMKVNLDKLSELRIPVDGTFDAGMYGNTWCIKPDFEANKKAMHEFIYE